MKDLRGPKLGLGNWFIRDIGNKGRIKEKRQVRGKGKVAQSCPTLCDPMGSRLLHPWDFLGKSTGVGCHFLLQGIFLTQGSNPGLPHCR